MAMELISNDFATVSVLKDELYHILRGYFVAMSAQKRNRTAQACEPCRRKKSKCTGEKPVCSFCQRLNQSCSYKNRHDNESRERKRRRILSSPAETETRLEELETTVEEIVDTFPLFLNSTRGMNTSEDLIQPQPRNSDQYTRDFHPADWLATNTTLSFENLVVIYVEKFHGQPLLLFDPEKLSQDLRQWPKHLFFSFFALVSCYTSYRGNSVNLMQIVGHHIDIGRSEIAGCIHNIQALCLLTLWEISHGDATSASIHIEVAQALSLQLWRKSKPDNLDVLRCCCSAVILASMTGNGLISSTSAVARPILTMSPPLPERTKITSKNVGTEWPQDNGVYAICVDLFRLWARVMSLYDAVWKGEATTLWSAQSPYHEVRTALFEFETRMSSNHRLRETGFASRTPSEIGNAVCYWRLWFTSQVLFHAVQLAVNHPFIHIVNQQRLRSFQPPSFQQQTIDQTLLHAKWIVHLHQMRSEKNLEIDDPFIAYLSAIAASAYLFFLESRDPKVRSDALNGFSDCQMLVARHSQRWDHLQRKSELLETLSSVSGNEGHRTVRTSWLWELLQYSNAMSGEDSIVSGETVCLQTTTQFTSPVDAADIHQNDDEISSSDVQQYRDVTQSSLYDINGAPIIDLDVNFLTNTDAMSADCDPNFWLDLGQF